MQIMTLTILGIYSGYPGAKSSEIAYKLGIVPQMVKQARKALEASNFVVRTKEGWYVTFAGRLALTKFDKEKARLQNERVKQAIALVCTVLKADPEDLKDFSLMNKGMTNDSYTFYCKDKKYIYRLAGQGTEFLVDRHREYANYLALEGEGISDKVIYLNAMTGTKISEFIEDSTLLDLDSEEDIAMALAAVRHLHTCGIKTTHNFDFRETISYYEDICHNSEVEFFSSYFTYKSQILHLLDKISTLCVPTAFCHIDFIPDNCMIKDGRVILIDWEYAGMQDPLVDIAMFSIAGDFDKARSDRLLTLYLEKEPSLTELFRFYTYVATGSLMWSLWSEYKASQGETFEGYTDRLYNLCKEYSAYALELSQQI